MGDIKHLINELSSINHDVSQLNVFLLYCGRHNSDPATPCTVCC